MLDTKLLYAIIVLLIVQGALAQETNIVDSLDQKNTKHQKLRNEGVSYTDFTNTHEIHKNFTLDYKISSSVFLEIHGYRDKYATVDTFGGHFIRRKYVTNRLYMYTGVQAEFAVDYQGTMSMSYLESLNGIGYDVTDNFSMRVEKSFGLSKGLQNGYSNPSPFTIRNTFKF